MTICLKYTKLLSGIVTCSVGILGNLGYKMSEKIEKIEYDTLMEK